MTDMPPFSEAGCAIRIIETREEREQAFRLRHTVYCQKLGWVAARADGRERDRYDPGSTTLGVFATDGQILGLVRLIPPGRPFMLEDDFRVLLRPGYRVRKGPDTVEVTRLTTRPQPPRALGAPPIASLLYKAIYRWSRARGVRFLYIVVESRFLRHLRHRGLPCIPLGPPYRFGEGPPVVAALLDRALFERQADANPTPFCEWLRGDGPIHRTARPWRWPGRDYARSASPWHCRDET